MQLLVFDEELKSLRGLGTPIDLMMFYNSGVSITQVCFVHGNEEILFIDSNTQARIFSLSTLQPKYLLSILSFFLSNTNTSSQTCFSTPTADATRDLLGPRWVMRSRCTPRRWRAYNNSLSLVNIRIYLRNFRHTPRLPCRPRRSAFHVNRQSE
jgi:hypothetical protein